MHWNFFITLGLLPPFVTFLRLIKWRKLPYSVFAFVIIVGYESALTHLPIREYKDILSFIVSSERTDLLSQNREGLFSFIGTIALDFADDRVSLNISCGHGYWKPGFACITGDSKKDIRLVTCLFNSINHHFSNLLNSLPLASFSSSSSPL